MTKHSTISIFNQEPYTNTTSHNHGIHSYPAKFPPQFPRKIIEEFSQKGSVILDPFCGSGTTLVEAMLQGRRPVGTDINEIALLITRVKTNIYSSDQILRAKSYLESINEGFKHGEYSEITCNNIVDFQGRDHWFQKNMQKEIQYILNEINREQDLQLRLLLKVILSEIIVKVSNQESDTRYAAKKKDLVDGYALQSYYKSGTSIIERIECFQDSIKDYTALDATIKNCDARDLSFIEDEQVDLILTSPPYANTYDYYLYHKHRMNWLGYSYKEAMKKEIGSRNEYSSKKKEVSEWEKDIYLSLKEQKRVLKNGGYIFWIIGDSVIRGELIKIDKMVERQCEKLGLEIVNKESVLLSKNSRKFNKKFGSKLEKEEHVLQIYKKVPR